VVIDVPRLEMISSVAVNLKFERAMRTESFFPSFDQRISAEHQLTVSMLSHQENSFHTL
jgi:hypothetical protein